MNERTIAFIWFGVFGTLISSLLIISSCVQHQTTDAVKACMSMKGTNYLSFDNGPGRCIQ